MSISLTEAMRVTSYLSQLKDDETHIKWMKSVKLDPESRYSIILMIEHMNTSNEQEDKDYLEDLLNESIQWEKDEEDKKEKVTKLKSS